MLKITRFNRILINSFYKDLIITFIGQILVMILTFSLNKLIASKYSVEMFGVYNLVRRFISVISFVILAAQGIAIPKFIAEIGVIGDKNKKESYMLSSLLIIIISFLLVVSIITVGSSFFAKVILGNANKIKYLLPACLYSFGMSIITYTYSFYRGENKFIEYNVINILLQLGLVICCFITSPNLYVLYHIWIIFLLIYASIILSGCYIKNKFRFKNLGSKLYTLPILLKYSMPRIPGEFILFSYNLVPITIINNKFGLEEVGYFSAAVSINTVISPFFGMIGTLLLPLVSKSKVNNTGKQVNRKIKYLAIIYLILGLIGIIFVYAFGKTILRILFNEKYISSMNIVRLTILSILPNSFYLLLRNPIDGISNFPYNTLTLVISFIIYIIMLLFAKSIEMCAIAMFSSYVFLGVLSLLVWIKLSSNSK